MVTTGIILCAQWKILKFYVVSKITGYSKTLHFTQFVNVRQIGENAYEHEHIHALVELSEKKEKFKRLFKLQTGGVTMTRPQFKDIR